MMKRTLSILLVLAMLVGNLPILAAADSQAHPYVKVVEQAMKAGTGGYGMLYDVDGNGADELLMIYNARTDSIPAGVYSIHTLSGDRAVPLVSQTHMFYEAGAPGGSIGVVETDGRRFVAVEWSNGYVEAYTHSSSGHWVLYAVDGESVRVDTEVSYEVTENISTGQIESGSYFKLNGKEYAYSEYKKWSQNMQHLSRAYYYDWDDSNTSDVMKLDSLLAHVKTLSVPTDQPTTGTEKRLVRIIMEDDKKSSTVYFDKRGLPVKEDWTVYGDVYSQEYIYDAQGRYLYSTGDIIRPIDYWYTYDDVGNLIQVRCRDEYGVTTEYFYYSDGTLSHSIDIGYNGDAALNTTFVCDSEKRTVQALSRNYDDSTSTWTYQYNWDDHDRIISETSEYNDEYGGYCRTYTYEYEKYWPFVARRIVEDDWEHEGLDLVIQDKTGRTIWDLTNTYFTYGEEIEEVRYDRDGYVTSAHSDHYTWTMVYEEGAVVDTGVIPKPSAPEKRVTSVTQTYANGSTCTFSFNYNADGLIHSVAQILPDDATITTYTYDKEGCLLREEVSNLGDNNPKTEYHYNSQGLLTSVTGHGEGGSSGITYTYDSQGRVIKAVSNSGVADYVNEYTYSADGLKQYEVETCTDIWGGDPIITRTTHTYTYDNQGRVTKKTSQSEDYISTIVYDYNCGSFVAISYNGNMPSSFTIQDNTGKGIWDFYIGGTTDIKKDQDGYITFVKSKDSITWEIEYEGVAIQNPGDNPQEPEPDSTNFFEVGVDSNNFGHDASSFGYNSKLTGCNRYSDDSVGVVYPTSSIYYEKLTEGLSWSKKIKLLKIRDKGTWIGSCFGLAVSMLYANTGEIQISDFSDPTGTGLEYDDVATYSNLCEPSVDLNLRDYINYAQLLQYTDQIVGTKLSNAWLFEQGKWTKFWNSLAQDAIQAAENQEPLLLCYYYEDKGHAVLICGCDDSNPSELVFKIYDSNIRNVSWRISEVDYDFIYLHVNPNDADNFHFTQNNKAYPYNTINSKNWKSFKRYDLSAVDPTVEIDPIKEGIAGSLPTAAAAYSGRKTMCISANSNTPFRLEASDGTYLVYDGATCSGNMDVIDVDYTGELVSEIEITVAFADAVTITEITDGATYSLLTEDTYFTASAENADSIAFTTNEGVSFAGDDYTFYVGMSLVQETGLMHITGSCSDDSTIEYRDDDIALSSEGTFHSVATEKHTEDGMETTDSTGGFSSGEINHDGTIDAGKDDGEITLGDVNGDGKINPKDAAMVLQHFVGKPITGFDADAADVNNDGRINPKDAAMILQRFVDKLDENFKPRG